jgi:3-deoxy-D-arabino-heptulosonate 7-phosphate (DAHP) synthase class II
MERIKEQINGILTYTSSDLEGLKEEYQELGVRINEGLSKMKASAVFTDSEIRETGEYARQLLIDKFEIAKRAIIDSVRESFEF